MNNSDPRAELTGRIVSLTQACPKGTYVDDCPFRMFQGLGHGTKMNTLGQMDHAALVKLFDYPSNCRCPADPRQPPAEPRPGCSGA
jgi:hypothetical protein